MDNLGYRWSGPYAPDRRLRELDDDGDEDGSAGVREPRKPKGSPPAMSAAAELPIEVASK